MSSLGTRTGLRRPGGTPGRLADIAFGLLLVVGLVIEVAAVVSRRPAWPVGAALILITAAVCGAALLRRRHLAGAAGAAILLCGAAELIDWQTERLGQPAPVAGLALLVVVASAVRLLASPLAAAGVVAGSGAVAVGTVERYATYLAEDVPNAWTATLVMVVGWALAVTLGLWRRFADAQRRAAAQEIRSAERLALARDLHDVAAHHLTGLIISTQVAQLDTRAAPEQLRVALSEIEAAGARALASLRQVARLLRDGEPAVAPLPDSVAELVDRFNGTGIRAELDLPDGPLPVRCPPEVTVGIYRIVQEALTNVAQHARDARTVTVTLAHDPRTVRVRIADDGQSRPSTGRDGHGLVGMRERTAALDGELSAGPGSPGGWTVEATLPIPAAT